MSNLIPKIKIIRKGYDVRTGDPVDMAFDSTYGLQGRVRAIRRTTDGDFLHGLTYTPEFKLMVELPTQSVNTDTDTYSAIGTREWLCPDGVTQATVKLWGGGGGGSGIATNYTEGGGGGGAGGQFVQKVVNVTAGNTYTVVVGDGGAGGISGSGGGGQSSTFESTQVVAKGGQAGQSYENGGAGGTGSTTGGVGTTVYKGGNGGVYHQDGSGYDTGAEGGGGAGTTGNGGNALGNSWPDPGGLGTSLSGGNGAMGFPASYDGWDGSSAGGGGGGGSNMSTSYSTNRQGGEGGSGRAEITYTRTVNREKAMGNARSSYPKVNQFNGNVAIGSFISNFYALPYSYDDYAATWFYPMVTSMLSVPESIPPNVQKDIPKFTVGVGDHDYQKKGHSYFDSMRVYKTGTLSISKPAVTYHNGDTGLVEITTTSVDHNLGYIPMISPQVDWQISLVIYREWLNQWYGRGAWIVSKQYVIKEVVTNGGASYECIKSNISSSDDEPDDGVNWATYWKLISPVSWADATSYVVGDYINVMTGLPAGYYIRFYKCIANHTSGASTKPETGGSWATYWVNVDDEFAGIFNEFDISLNDLEDIKYIFGGVFVINDYGVEFYATSTQLILKLIRTTYDFEGLNPSSGNNLELAPTDISVDYTIFSNRADEEFNLLT